MKNEDKISRRQKDIIRYLKDEMSSEERNQFEREMEKDPFLADAVEGYARMDIEDLGSDMEYLGNKLKKRTAGKSTVIYRIAAVVVVLIGISSVLLVRNLRQPEMKLADSKGITSEISEGEESHEAYDMEQVKTEDMDMGKQPRKTIPEEKIIADTGSQEPDDRLIVPQKSEKGAVLAEEMEEVSAKAVIEGISDTSVQDEAKLIVEGVAMDEARPKVAARKKEVVVSTVAGIIGSRDALPVIGMDEYREYIDKYKHYPDNFEGTDSVRVELGIIIQTDGTIEDILILNNPPGEFSDEAKRLVLEGPEWLPALKDGQVIPDTVKIEIDFCR